MIGTTISHFRILDLLGKGGMGEVYRAEDTTLNRQVAIKVLPELLAHDPERLARFEREAKLLATLNHPNIATIYGLEEADGKRLLILELVEGETLAERIKKGPIPVEETLHLALQITEGLEAAHEKGIIHRDLKPGNIKLTPEGKVKILDFGLAKAFEEETPATDASHSPTLTDQMTQAGVILGTAAYMSPEQAKGKVADKRADIWAFGAVLFEMLTGKRAFEGDTITVTLGAIIHKEPDWKSLPANLPGITRSLLRQCLKKDTDHRLHDVADARIDVEEAISEPTSISEPTTSTAQPRWKRGIPIVLAAVLMAITGLAVWNLKPTESGMTTRFYHQLSEGQSFTRTGRQLVSISPDGSKIVYVADNRLYLRNLGEMEARPIQGTFENPSNPFFSPDGQWVGFFAERELKKVAITGGTPVALCDATNLFGGSWGIDGRIVYGQPEGIMSVSSNGGTPELLIPAEPAEVVYGPQVLPSSEWLLFTLVNTSRALGWDNAQIVVQSLESGERKVIWEGGSDARYVPTGHLIYALEGTLFAVVFEEDSLEVKGGAVPIVEGVQRAPSGQTGTANFAFSDRGTLAYVQGSEGGGAARNLLWVDRHGTVEPLEAPSHTYRNPRLSPDGQQLALTILSGSEPRDIWVYDIPRQTLTRLTFEGDNRLPLWSPDGMRIVFRSNRAGGPPNLYWKLADGSGDAERLTTSDDTQTPGSWSPDGKALAFHSYGPGESATSHGDIWVLPLEGEREPQPFLQTQYFESSPSFSPNGNWLAYVSNESGRNEIYVQPYPGPGGKRQISVEGGREPVWSRNGQELFYRSDGGEKMLVVEVQTEPSFSAGTPRLLFEGNYTTSVGALPFYDVTADGQRFLMIQTGTSVGELGRINVVLNWFEELKRLVPTD